MPIVSAQDFDPLGTPAEENPDKAELAIDGSAATGWPTSSYFRPNLGGLKPGVGLVLDLGTQVPVSSVQVALGGGTTSLELRPTPTGVNSPPVALPDVTAPVAATRGAGQVRLTPKKPVTTRFLVLWITDLPQVSSGRFRAEIMDVQVRR